MKIETDRFTSKAIATIAASIACSVMIWQTNGQHGIGWFVLCLAFIW